MALFESQEEKAAKRKEKENALLEKYGLDELSNAKDIASVRHMASDLMGSGLFEAADFIGNDNNALLKVILKYQKVQMQQNFIMIRQLDRIAKAQKALVALSKKG